MKFRGKWTDVKFLSDDLIMLLLKLRVLSLVLTQIKLQLPVSDVAGVFSGIIYTLSLDGFIRLKMFSRPGFGYAV